MLWSYIYPSVFLFREVAGKKCSILGLPLWCAFSLLPGTKEDVFSLT